MARELYNRVFAPTIPTDLNDPVRFGQILETTKDVLTEELRKFIGRSYQTSARRQELPTIQKYELPADSTDRFATAAHIIQKLPDLKERPPQIAIMASAGQQLPLTIGPPFIKTVQDPSSVTAPLPEPYAFEDGDVLTVRTRLSSTKYHTQNITFASGRFPDANPISAALAVDVADEFNEQALHSRARPVEVDGQTYLRVETAESTDARMPIEIEVHPSSSDNTLEATGFGRSGEVTDIDGDAPDMTISAPAGAFSADDIGRFVCVSGSTKAYFNDGRFPITAFDTDDVTDTITFTNKKGRVETDSPAAWFIGLSDNHRNHVPKHRYGLAWTINAQIDVYTADTNTRTELADLVLSFLSFFLESKFFSFLGRSGFTGQTVTGEHYQISIRPPIVGGSETEFPRSGDLNDKVHVCSFQVSLDVSMYIDRDAYAPGTDTPFIIDRDAGLEQDDTLILPDEGTFEEVPLS